MFGLGSVAQVVTGHGAFGQYLSINIGFGLGVTMGVHVGGSVSGNILKVIRIGRVKRNNGHRHHFHNTDNMTIVWCFSFYYSHANTEEINSSKRTSSITESNDSVLIY